MANKEKLLPSVKELKLKFDTWFKGRPDHWVIHQKTAWNAALDLADHEWNTRAAQPVAVEGMPKPAAYLTADDLGRCSLTIGKIKPHSLPLIRLDACAQAFAELAALRGEVADLIEARDSRVSERLAAIDALRAERDAALAEVEQKETSLHEALLQASTQAEVADTLRADKARLVELLRKARQGLDEVGVQDHLVDYASVSKTKRDIDAALANEVPK